MNRFLPTGTKVMTEPEFGGRRLLLDERGDQSVCPEVRSTVTGCCQ